MQIGSCRPVSNTGTLPHFLHNEVRHLLVPYKTLQNEGPISISNVIFHPHLHPNSRCCTYPNNHAPRFSHDGHPTHTYNDWPSPNSTLACLTNAYLTKKFLHKTFLTYPSSRVELTMILCTPYPMRFFLGEKCYTLYLYRMYICFSLLYHTIHQGKDQALFAFYPQHLVFGMNERMD